LLPLIVGNKNDSLCAQELTLNGIGPVNHSLAGVAAALPSDSAGAIYWNPATMSFLEQSEFQLGWGRHNAPWYGDEPIAYTALILAYLLLESITNNDSPNDPYYSSNNRQKSTYPSYRVGAVPKIRVPEFSYVYNKGKYWSFGLAVSEFGANKIGAFFDSEQGDVIGIYRYPFRGYEFIPALSCRPNKQFSMGFAPIFSIDEMPNASLPVILTEDSWGLYSGVSQDQRSRAGVGVQVGLFYTLVERLRFGVSVLTPQ
jgi:long-subunit fatty acid transport protein